jgi:DNA-binding PadR family transcriptional regulator
VSSSRLYVLTLLARHGPMHGHKMRLTAQQDRLDLWTDVRPGALYGVLKRLAGEGLITATASERAGSYPERTVYEITADGRRALEALQDGTLRTVLLPMDPFDLALAAGDLTEPDRLRTALADRRDTLLARRSGMRHQAEYADPYLSVAERKVLGHLLARLDTEISWHEDVLAALPEILADFDRRRSLPMEEQ